MKRYIRKDDIKFSSVEDMTIEKQMRSEITASEKKTGPKHIFDEIYDAAKRVLMSPEFGFSENELDDYMYVGVDKDATGIRIEVRAVVSDSGMREIAKKLDKIVQKYDPDSYFDNVDFGVIEAFIRNLSGLSDVPEEHISSEGRSYVLSSGGVDSTTYGGAYDIDPYSYFTREELNEFAYYVADMLTEDGGNRHQYDVTGAYIDDDLLELTILCDGETEFTVEYKIDMRRIRKPSDIYKYSGLFIGKFKELFSEYYDDIYSATNTSGFPSIPKIYEEDDE